MRRLSHYLVIAVLTGGIADQSFAAQPNSALPRFNTEHVEGALAYFSAPEGAKLREIASTQAAQHLLKHSAMTGYYTETATSLDITQELIGGEIPDSEAINGVKTLLVAIAAVPDRQRSCTESAAEYLPDGFRFIEPLYLTWGYDIGVSMNGTASVNLAHRRFATQPDEVWFYCTHEMHHAGVTSYHPFPMRIASIATASQMFNFIRYATMLEGMAVHAAYAPRERAGALSADPDYVALQNSALMAEYETAYWSILNHFEEAGERLLTETDWDLVERLSDGERLWYRVGAMMAARIEGGYGRGRLQELVVEGPDALFAAFDALPN